MRSMLVLLLSFCAAPLWAACEGRDLLSQMPPDARAELTEATAAKPYPEGLFWRATRGDQVVHLVGTMHFYDPRHEASFQQLLPWADAASVILLELGAGDEQRLQAEITANPGIAFIMEGPTLPELLPPED